MEQLLVTVEDVKNELDVSIADELHIQPRQADRWIMRQQQVILNYIALSVGGTEQAAQLLGDSSSVDVVRKALIEQIGYVARNNFVQADLVMNLDGQTVAPTIAPLAHQMLLNAGLLRKTE